MPYAHEVTSHKKQAPAIFLTPIMSGEAISDIRFLSIEDMETNVRIDICAPQSPVFATGVDMTAFQPWATLAYYSPNIGLSLKSEGEIENSYGIYISNSLSPECVISIRGKGGNRLSINAVSDQDYEGFGADTDVVFELFLDLADGTERSCESEMEAEKGLDWYLRGSEDIPYCFAYAWSFRMDLKLSVGKREIFASIFRNDIVFLEGFL